MLRRCFGHGGTGTMQWANAKILFDISEYSIAADDNNYKTLLWLFVPENSSSLFALVLDVGIRIKILSQSLLVVELRITHRDGEGDKGHAEADASNAE